MEVEHSYSAVVVNSPWSFWKKVQQQIFTHKLEIHSYLTTLLKLHTLIFMLEMKKLIFTKSVHEYCSSYTHDDQK